MTTLGSDIKDYPPDDHTLSHDSNPLAASISAVRQKIKNAAVSSLGKPNKVSFCIFWGVFSYFT